VNFFEYFMLNEILNGEEGARAGFFGVLGNFLTRQWQSFDMALIYYCSTN
jgi:hypothetical protein